MNKIKELLTQFTDFILDTIKKFDNWIIAGVRREDNDNN